MTKPTQKKCLPHCTVVLFAFTFSAVSCLEKKSSVPPSTTDGTALQELPSEGGGVGGGEKENPVSVFVPGSGQPENRYWDLYKSPYCKQAGFSTCLKEAEAYHRVCEFTSPGTLLPQRVGQRTLYFQRSTERYLVAEGDILLVQDPQNLKTKELTTATVSLRLWPNGKIPYYFRSEVSEDVRATILEAMKIWTEATGGMITFQESQPAQLTSLEITRGSDTAACYASVGWAFFPTLLMAPNGCGLEATVHELGHTIGLFHEHQRHDRNVHVQVMWCNIPLTRREAFYADGQIMSGFIYDYHSIMHYTRTSFIQAEGPVGLVALASKDKQQSVQVILPERPSSVDILKVSCLYAPQRGTQCPQTP